MNKDNLHPHPSLPARPPASTMSAPPNRNTAGRGVGANMPATYAAFASGAYAPTNPYAQPSVSTPYQSTAYPTSTAYYNSYQAYSATAAAAPLTGSHGTYDPNEDAARLAEWSSAYAKEDANAKKVSNATSANRSDAHSTPNLDTGASTTNKQKTVIREGGGKTWEDPTLLEWNPLHPRLFVGNLAGEVTDDSLLKAFSKYPSVSKARVVRDKRSTKSKSYGFVSFADTDEYFRAAKEMQGKYIGSHPVLIKRATSEVKPVTKRDDKHGKFNKNKNNKKKTENTTVGAMPGVVPFVSSGVQKKGKHGGPRLLG